MEFGYFTLSDNHYENNTRTANQFVADITDEALYADETLEAHEEFLMERVSEVKIMAEPAAKPPEESPLSAKADASSASTGRRDTAPAP